MNKKFIYLLLLFYILPCISETIYNDPYFIRTNNVTNMINDFFNRKNLLNCFKKEMDESLLLKCWRDNELIDVVIDIQYSFWI
jgi:hypothetical protein|tara:strand:- start:626 stop:874 length:249 start_codon:yes stop_codon:yes gene_type:complete